MNKDENKYKVKLFDLDHSIDLDILSTNLSKITKSGDITAKIDEDTFNWLSTIQRRLLISMNYSINLNDKDLVLYEGSIIIEDIVFNCETSEHDIADSKNKIEQNTMLKIKFSISEKQVFCS